MASLFPCVKNSAAGYIFYVGLIDQANTKLLKANPTLAAGDVKVSIDGGALNNLGTLPTVTPAAGRMVKVTLAQGEINGDNITVVFNDAAGAEWCDLVVNIQTVTRRFDDLAFPATSGRSMVVDAAGLVDANAVKLGPTGSGTAQTARDIGASVVAASVTADVGITQAGADKVWGSATRTLTAFSTALALSVWDVLLTAIATSASIGKKLKDWVLGTDNKVLLSADSQAGVTIPTVTTVTGGALDSTVAKEATLNTKISTALSFTGANVNAESKVTAAPSDMAKDSTVMKAASYTAPDNADIVLIKAKTDNLPDGILKNTALGAFEFLMVDATDGITAETGLTVSAERSLDGAAFVACANSVVEVAHGIYKIDLAAADLNADVVTLRFSAAGALDRLVTIKTNT